MRVWFNRHFALLYRVLGLIRQGDVERNFTLVCTHKSPYFVGFAAADAFAQEPQGLSTADYVDWCLAFAMERKIDVFLPSHEANALVAARERFAQQGIRVLGVANAFILPRLHNKAWVYRKLRGKVPLAQSWLLRDPAQLQAALEQLWAQDLQACIKPTVSIYGKGFFRLMQPSDTRRSQRRLTPQAWIDQYGGPGQRVSHQVLEYLPGHEFSVDCIGDAGRLVTGVVRKKSITTPTQTLEDHPVILSHAACMVAQFGLSGLVNIQFKEDVHGEPKLLEINPRASGGVAMSCLSGINLPYIALCGEIHGYAHVAIAQPRLGLRVTEVGSPLVLPPHG
jgi:ATP-grasp in the biosynthetic pathway with Ter operon